MDTVTSEPRTTSLDEQIDEAVDLISARDVRRAADYLEVSCNGARGEKDLEALQRIADIAHSSRYLSRRHQYRFDRLARRAEANMAEVLRDKNSATASPPTRGGRDSLAYSVLLLAINVFVFLTLVMSEPSDAVVLPFLILVAVGSTIGLLLGALGPLFEPLLRSEDERGDWELERYLAFLLLAVPIYSLLLYFSINIVRDILGS